MCKNFIKTNIYSSDYKLLCIIEKDNNVIKYEYDDKGRLINIGNKHFFKYDNKDRLIEELDITKETVTTTIENEYDRVGNLIKKVTTISDISDKNIKNTKSSINTMLYDNKNRLIVVNNNSETIEIIEYNDIDNIVSKKLISLSLDKSRIINIIDTKYNENNMILYRHIVDPNTKDSTMYDYEYLDNNPKSYTEKYIRNGTIIKIINHIEKIDNGVFKEINKSNDVHSIKEYMENNHDILLSEEEFYDGDLDHRISSEISNIGPYIQITYYSET